MRHIERHVLQSSTKANQASLSNFLLLAYAVIFHTWSSYLQSGEGFILTKTQQ